MTRPRSSYAGAVLIACFLGASVALAGSEPAFPGAEGFGAKTIGGRGGKVIWVTNLNASGPGSLREAVDRPGPRIIKFKVAGTIESGRRCLWIGFPYRSTYKKLIREGKKREELENPYSFVTIDGASAPPPGITIHGRIDLGPYALKQVIVRNLRVRDNGMAPRGAADCLPASANHVIIDHCSLQWARDEVAGAWFPNAHAITYQWCIIGPGWGQHACGFIAGKGPDRLTVHHCLFPHNHDRNPLFCGNSRKNWVGKYPNDTPVFDCRNNVIYNCHSASVLADGAHVNLVGNRYIRKAGTGKGHFVNEIYSKDRVNPTICYLKGNISPFRPTNDMDEWAGAGHCGYPEKGPRKWTHWPGPWKWGQKRDTPFPVAPVITQTAQEATDLVLSQVGAWPRDAVDAGIIRTVLHRSGHRAVKQTLPSDIANARPIASAKATAVKGKPLTVRFQAEGRDMDSKIESYTWHFGDGRRAIGQNATHTYTEPGEYDARLFVMDDRGMTGTATLSISVGKEGFKAERVTVPIAPYTPQPPPKKLDLPTVNLAAVLAGPPTEEDWIKAPRLAPFIILWNWQKAPQGLTDARILHDAKNLYLRVTTGGMEPASLKRIKTSDRFISPRRRKYTYVGHVNVMTFLSPNHGGAPWYRFDVGDLGARYSGKMADADWRPTPDWRFMSRVIGDKWQLTLVLPFEALRVIPHPAQVWGLKFIVNLQKDVIHIWPPVEKVGKDQYCVPHTSDPIYYAKLRFQ